ncbi:Reverse transcriptase (RNA-dependent DNA polymerase) [Popillia japonica]|uniref:Reverse transcriptase (RNA-dependent DNA polymerase) n=1 Tax=Popillia japonica TaxID=7064 RepID=A0AAW1N542_POPJA
MASENSINIEKLKGSENYHTWRFAMENVLDFCGLDKCITNPCTETDEVKLRKAKARIVLSIDESLYVHIQTLSTAAQIWSALKELYDNRGLTRQIGLLRKTYSESAESALYSRNKNGSSKKGKQNHKKQLICYICNRKGHISTHCPQERKFKERKRKSGRCFCIYFSEKLQLIVAIYVDDLLIFWKDINDRDNLKKALSEAFHMKDIGKAKHCIGLNITYDEKIKAISPDQSKYIKEILVTFGMAACKPAGTPSDPSQRLSDRMCNTDEVIENVPYQEAVGSLLYLVLGTRPGIAHAVNDVTRFNSNHGKAHWQAVKRIFRYLKGTEAMWLKQLAQNLDTSFKTKPTTIVCDNQSAINLAQSDGYRARSKHIDVRHHFIRERMWLKQLAQNLDTSFKTKPTTIVCDNQSAINLAQSDGYRAIAKHIDVRHHFIRERVEDHAINIIYVPTQEMVADSLTKAVHKGKAQFCAIGMGLVDSNEIQH